MEKGILVDFQSDGTQVQIIGNGIDVLKAMELVLYALDESIGSTALSDDMLERLVLKRKQSKEQRPSGLTELLMMMEALNAMKSGERESFTSFHDRFMSDYENKTVDQLRDELRKGAQRSKLIREELAEAIESFFQSKH